MNRLRAHSSKNLRGAIRVPGDKSISHRALLLGALATGTSTITGFLPSGDCMASLNCIRALGTAVDVENPTTLAVHGGDLHAPGAPLNCVRSGTTMRLLAGILAGQPFDSALSGDPQLLLRPMRRVVQPLREMGADIDDTDGRAPLFIRGRLLQGCALELKVASAQVKSALLLAGLRADGPVTVVQPGPARDHTERMLAAMGARVETDGLTVTIYPVASPLSPLSTHIPGDFSSAAFPLAAAAIVPGSSVTVRAVGVNETRTGLLDVLRGMGARIDIVAQPDQSNEPVADVLVRWTELKGTEIAGGLVVRMIDEFPVLAVVATQAHGMTVVRDAAELRVKETDRIVTVADELRKLGARIEPLPDGFVVEGPTRLCGGTVDSHGDHRLAMAFTVAGLVAEGAVTVENTACIDDSFPGFVQVMQDLGADCG